MNLFCDVSLNITNLSLPKQKYFHLVWDVIIDSDVFDSGQLFQFDTNIISMLDFLIHKDSDFIYNVLLKQTYLKYYRLRESVTKTSNSTQMKAMYQNVSIYTKKYLENWTSRIWIGSEQVKM